MALTKPVFIVGFMGAGKTTYAKKLASKLEVPAIDLDAKICTFTGYNSIAELVKEKGITHFREIEQNVLKTISTTPQVISTGGGTPCFFKNMDWMKQQGTVVFLNVSSAIILSRLKTTDLNNRPLLKNLNDSELELFVTEKLAERLPFYKLAHLEFNPIKQTLDELVKLLILEY